MRRNDAVSKRSVEHVKHVIRVAECEIIKLKSYSSKSRWIFSISSIWSRDIALQVLAITLRGYMGFKISKNRFFFRLIKK